MLLLQAPHIIFGNLIGEIEGGGGPANLAEWVKNNFAPTIDVELLNWVRAHWDGKLIVKGILDIADARAAIAAGADAIVVYNHGRRQLDGAMSTAVAFPVIRDAVGGTAELFAGFILADLGIAPILDLTTRRVR